MTEEGKPAKKNHTLRNILIVLVLLVALACAAVALGGRGGDQPAAVGTATPAPLAPPFADIEATVAAGTEAQWKSYLPTLAGQRVQNWQGWVVDVDQAGSKYTLWVDLDPPGSVLSTQDVYIPVDQALAVSLAKGQPVAFSGTIADVTELLGTISVTLQPGAQVRVGQ